VREREKGKRVNGLKSSLGFVIGLIRN